MKIPKGGFEGPGLITTEKIVSGPATVGGFKVKRTAVTTVSQCPHCRKVVSTVTNVTNESRRRK
jgi:hypothetical protein